MIIWYEDNMFALINYLNFNAVESQMFCLPFKAQTAVGVPIRGEI